MGGADAPPDMDGYLAATTAAVILAAAAVVAADAAETVAAAAEENDENEDDPDTRVITAHNLLHSAVRAYGLKIIWICFIGARYDEAYGGFAPDGFAFSAV